MGIRKCPTGERDAGRRHSGASAERAAVGLLGCAGAFARTAAASEEPAWSCDFEGTYCGMQEQSKIEPAHRSRFVQVARGGGMAIELTTFPGDDQVHSSRDWERD